jgi:hypothetical protein
MKLLSLIKKIDMMNKPLLIIAMLMLFRIPVFSQEQETAEEKESTPKSFTLDTNDATLEEMTVTDKDKDDKSKDRQRRRKDSQDEIQTLAGDRTHHGGFGAITFTATDFNDKDMILIGIRGGWIINRALAIGFEGHGLLPIAEYSSIDSATSTRAVGGYGGMFIEPIVYSNKIVHVTFPISAGAGWVGYVVDWEDYNYYETDLVDDDVFWYIKPGASVELNVARNFRINLGASYRFTQDLQLLNTPSDGFTGWNYFLTLKFGSF